ncbi:MAG TPA: threonine synthase [Acetobacteraceae bacterium]|nr:threonine synthase [Acetobacteraceae bacterium]
MRYVSTRGEAPPRDFAGVLLAGLAEDGGLFVPEAWPRFSPAEWRALRGLPYAELAARVMEPFVCDRDGIGFPDLQAMCRDAYRGFDHPAVAPLVQLEPNLFALELFHGPTLAFKDLALQLVGRMFDFVLTGRGERVTIAAATSGDTGSAAIEACRGRARVDIAVLHPEGRTSEVQRRQMTTIDEANICNIAVAGSFDDCQDLVKAMFADAPFRQGLRLSAMNSINWARIAAQVPYYAAAALALGAPDREVAIAVPTGNFGNVLAAYVAKRMGLPVARFIVAANANDILIRFLAANDMSVRGVVETIAPSMDIQVSSNFERLLFEFMERDAGRTGAAMAGFRKSGKMTIADDVWRRLARDFRGFAVDDAGALAEIARLHRENRYLADPHTAIGIAAARAAAPIGVPVIAAATAHPAKFPEAMKRALGFHPGLPERLADLYTRREHYHRAPADLAAVEALIRGFAHRNTA